MKRWLLIPLLSMALLVPAHADELSDRAAQVKSQLQTQILPDVAKISTANEKAEDAARNLTTLSHAHRLGYSTSDLNLLTAAQAHYKLLRDSRRDKTGDGFYMNPQDSKEPLKSTRLQGLVVSALVEYARASGEAEPRGVAVKVWRLIRERGRDKINGGYYDSFLSGTLGPTQASGSGNKSAQTHLALLQAGTALFDLTRDRSIRTDLVELLDLNEGRFFPAGSKAYSDIFTPEWKPFFPDPATDVPLRFELNAAALTIARAQTALGLTIGWVDFSRRTASDNIDKGESSPGKLAALTVLASNVANVREGHTPDIDRLLDGLQKGGSNATGETTYSGVALLDFVAAFEK